MLSIEQSIEFSSFLIVFLFLVCLFGVFVLAGLRRQKTAYFIIASSLILVFVVGFHMNTLNDQKAPYAWFKNMPPLELSMMSDYIRVWHKPIDVHRFMRIEKAYKEREQSTIQFDVLQNNANLQ